MILSSGKYNVEEDTQGKGLKAGRGWVGLGLRLSGKQRDLAMYTHTPITYSWLYAVYELACAYSTQAFVSFKERFANSTLFGAPAPDPCLIHD